MTPSARHRLAEERAAIDALLAAESALPAPPQRGLRRPGGARDASHLNSPLWHADPYRRVRAALGAIQRRLHALRVRVGVMILVASLWPILASAGLMIGMVSLVAGLVWGVGEVVQLLFGPLSPAAGPGGRP